MSDLVVDIAVNVSLYKTFHYLAPDEMRDALVPGSRVLVPFGSRRIPGTVLGFPEKPEAGKLKSIIQFLEDPLPPDVLELACWMADYYMHPIGSTIEAVVPKAVSRAKPKKTTSIRLLREPSTPVKGPKQNALIALLKEQGEVDLAALTGFSRATMNKLRDEGIIEIPGAGRGSAVRTARFYSQRSARTDAGAAGRGHKHHPFGHARNISKSFCFMV